MSRAVVAYVCAAVVFFAIDMLWLGVIAKDLYRSALGPLLLENPKWGAALTFYALYLVGLVIFCVLPGLDANSWLKAWGLGALFGLIAYATYDLTNYATLKNWPLNIVVIDLAWGTFLTSLGALGGYFGAHWWAAR